MSRHFAVTTKSVGIRHPGTYPKNPPSFIG